MNLNSWSMSRLGGLIVLGIGLIFGAVSYFMVQDMKGYSDNGVSVRGTVVENITEHRRGYTPLVRFTTNSGETIEFEDNVSSNPPAFNVGEKVDVLYIRDNPHDAIIANGMWLLPGIFSGVTAILLAIAAVCFVVDFKNRGKKTEEDSFKEFNNEDDFFKEADKEEVEFDTKVEVREFLRKKQKLEAIKHYKDMMNVSLKEASKAVDDIEYEMKAEEMKR